MKLYARRVSIAFDDLELFDALIQAKGGAIFAQMMAERVGDLGIDKGQQAVPLVDQRDPYPESRENAGVFASDYAGSDDGQGSRQPVEMENVVAGKDPVPVEWHVRVASIFRSDRDHDVARRDRARRVTIGMVEADRIRPDKRCLRRYQLDIVAHQLVTHDVDFVLDDTVGADQQILYRDVFFDGVGSAVELAGAIAGELEHDLAQGLRRDRAEIDAASADDGFALDDRYPLIELRALDRRALAGRPGTDY